MMRALQRGRHCVGLPGCVVVPGLNDPTPQRVLGQPHLRPALRAAALSIGSGGRMSRLTLSDFKREIRSLHGAHARIVGAETAVVSGEGEAIEDVVVLIFAFLDHPTAPRCYAWELDRRAVVVLHSAAIDSPRSEEHTSELQSLR